MMAHRFRFQTILLLLILLFAPGGLSLAQTSTVHPPSPTSISKPVDHDLFSIFLPLIIQPVPTVDSITIDNAEIRFYTVTGSTANEIRNSLNQNRPGSYDGWAQWHFTWSGCQDGGVQVNYTITVDFPQWSLPANPSGTLVQSWNLYINALALHEQGHVDLVMAAVPDFIDTLQNVPCNEINATANAMLAEINHVNEQYDEETDHGATQGAVFP
jgi:predicted secreted Zn-dependent protease